MANLRSILLSVFAATLKYHAVANNLRPTTMLKPLTPIADTNLFLNTPYKLHDRTRPGCYATWIMEDNVPRVYFVCNKNDQQWYSTTNASWIFERTEGSESITEYRGTVKLRNVGKWLTLTRLPSFLLSLGQYAANSYEDMWNVRSDPNNKNNLQLEIHNYWLYPLSYPNHRDGVFLLQGHPAGYPFSFAPVIELEARMYNFVFTRPLDGQIAQYSTKKDLIDSYDINNDSPASLSRTISVSEKLTNEFSWGFSESLKFFAKVTGSAGIPFLTEGKVETGFELTLTANQNWKDSVEKVFSMSYDINVPPHTNVKVSAWYDQIKGISMNYTAETEITGYITRITVFDDLENQSPATGELIRKQLEYSKFDGKIVEIKDYSVVAQIYGTMVATVGVRGQLNVNGKTTVVQINPH